MPKILPGREMGQAFSLPGSLIFACRRKNHMINPKQGGIRRVRLFEDCTLDIAGLKNFERFRPLLA